MPSVSPVLHTQDTSQQRDCGHIQIMCWQIILMYHWTTWWEETETEKGTKDGTSRSKTTAEIHIR